MRLKLAIEPVPISTWGRSLASLLPRKEWDTIRHKEYRKADFTCEVCGEVSLSLHCHEKWKFEDKKAIQRFAGFEVCCELCHDVHHFGRSTAVKSPAYVKRLINHWCKINERPESDFKTYQAEIFSINKRRANIYYIVKVGRKILG